MQWQIALIAPWQWDYIPSVFQPFCFRKVRDKSSHLQNVCLLLSTLGESVHMRSPGYSINMKAASAQTYFLQVRGLLAVPDITFWLECRENYVNRNKQWKHQKGDFTAAKIDVGEVEAEDWWKWKIDESGGGVGMEGDVGGCFMGPSICTSLWWGLLWGACGESGDICKGVQAVTGDHLCLDGAGCNSHPSVMITMDTVEKRDEGPKRF